MGLENEDGGSHLSLVEKALSVSESGAEIAGVFRIGALKPLCWISPAGFGQFRDFEESFGGGFSIAHFRRQLAKPQEVLLIGFKSNNPTHQVQRFLLLALLLQFFESVFIRAHGEALIGLLKQRSEANFLFPSWVSVACELLVSEAGASRVSAGDLALE